MTKRKIVTVSVPPDQLRLLDQYAERERVSRSFIVQRAIRAYLAGPRRAPETKEAR